MRTCGAPLAAKHTHIHRMLPSLSSSQSRLPSSSSTSSKFSSVRPTSSSSSSSFLVDGRGALNMRKLQQELHHALADDARLSRVDAVKKRAVRTVATYEEFKHRVACAHLTPLTRQEIQRVGQPQHGWGRGKRASSRKSSSSSSSGGSSRTRVSTATTQVNEKEKGDVSSSSSTLSSSSSSSFSSATFEKEWLHRLKAGQSVQDKLAFLREVGGGRFISQCFGSKEVNAEVVGDLLLTLRDGMMQGMKEKKKKKEEKKEEEEKEEEKYEGELLSLLHALVQTGRFHLTYAFLTPAQQTAGREMVERLEGREKKEKEATTATQMEELRRAFPSPSPSSSSST